MAGHLLYRALFPPHFTPRTTDGDFDWKSALVHAAPAGHSRSRRIVVLHSSCEH